jgi:hypothetical protein
MTQAQQPTASALIPKSLDDPTTQAALGAIWLASGPPDVYPDQARQRVSADILRMLAALAPDGFAPCLEGYGCYRCTRPAGHADDHIAVDADTLCAVASWDAGPDQ